MRTRIGMVAVLWWIAIGCALTPSAHAADPFYGLFASLMSEPAAKLNADLDAHASTGVGTIRAHLHWDRIERYPGVFDFTDADAMFNAASARGLTVLPMIIDTPSFYSTRPAGVFSAGWPPRDPVTIRRFASELARRYGTNGTYWGCVLPGLLCRRPYRPITAWQVWNEPDFLSWWQTGVNAGAYTALLREAYGGLKAGDPRSEVVIGGMTFRAIAPGAFLDQIYSLGAAAWFDSLAIHPYAVNVGGVVDQIRRMRAIATARGDTNVPIRVTEYGFATGGVREWVTTPLCQAALVAATTRELSARRTELGLRSIGEFQWRDRSADLASNWPNHAGLLYLDGTPKPALAAFTEAVAGRPATPGRGVADVCAVQHQG